MKPKAKEGLTHSFLVSLCLKTLVAEFNLDLTLITQIIS
jgi:hypothetical protein